MKANEAPEKLYIWFGHPYTVDYTKLSKRQFEEQVEYTRTDAFIEKACSWLKKNCKDYIIVDIDNKYEGIDGLFLEDFKNYLKGE